MSTIFTSKIFIHSWWNGKILGKPKKKNWNYLHKILKKYWRNSKKKKKKEKNYFGKILRNFAKIQTQSSFEKISKNFEVIYW